VILTTASLSILALGIYAACVSDPGAERREAIAVLGQYLGGLLIIGGLALIGVQLARLFDLVAVQI